MSECEFATKMHHTHSCQSCGLAWRPGIAPTVGVVGATGGIGCLLAMLVGGVPLATSGVNSASEQKRRLL